MAGFSTFRVARVQIRSIAPREFSLAACVAFLSGNNGSASFFRLAVFLDLCGNTCEETQANTQWQKTKSNP